MGSPPGRREGGQLGYPPGRLSRLSRLSRGSRYGPPLAPVAPLGAFGDASTVTSVPIGV